MKTMQQKGREERAFAREARRARRALSVWENQTLEESDDFIPDLEVMIARERKPTSQTQEAKMVEASQFVAERLSLIATKLELIESLLAYELGHSRVRSSTSSISRRAS